MGEPVCDRAAIAETTLRRETIEKLRNVIATIRRGFEISRRAARSHRRRAAQRQLSGIPVRFERGECLQIRRCATPFLTRPAELVPCKPDWQPGLLQTRHLHELHLLHEALPHQVLYLDLETCGLKSRPVFLVGVLQHDPVEGWVVEQYFARNYEEEAAILEAFWHVLRRHRVLVTFNGKAFDFPYVLDRSRYHRIKVTSGRSRSRSSLTHCDVLLYARRLWKERRELPDCRLQTLEYCLCGREREQDIPGWEIPAAYDRFVRQGRTDEVSRILDHNFYDLITLAELSFRVLHELGG